MGIVAIYYMSPVLLRFTRAIKLSENRVNRSRFTIIIKEQVTATDAMTLPVYSIRW